MSLAAEHSHPVEVECPSCSHRFRVPLRALSVGKFLPCRACGNNIQIATPALRHLLREIDRDLHSPDDLPIVLREVKCRPAEIHDADKEMAQREGQGAGRVR